MSNYLLGIDIGTGGSKALLIDEQGNIAASVTTEYPLLTPRALWSEQNPQDWYSATITSIAKCLEQSAIDPAKVSGGRASRRVVPDGVASAYAQIDYLGHGPR